LILAQSECYLGLALDMRIERIFIKESLFFYKIN